MAKESNKEVADHTGDAGKAEAKQEDHHDHGKGAAKGHGASGDATRPHSYTKDDVEHVKNAILIDKYSSLYDSHLHAPWFTKIWHSIVPHHHHHAIINTDVATPEFESLSENEQVDRSLYALWKINKVNPHFFAPSEQDILDPREYRIARLVFRYSALIGVSSYLCFNFMRGRLNLKRTVIGLGAFAAIKGVNLATEVFYENAKMPSRRKLARQYMQLYSPKQLFEISKPNYPFEKLEHMHNKKHI